MTVNKTCGEGVRNAIAGRGNHKNAGCSCHKKKTGERGGVNQLSGRTADRGAPTRKRGPDVFRREIIKVGSVCVQANISRRNGPSFLTSPLCRRVATEIPTTPYKKIWRKEDVGAPPNRSKPPEGKNEDLGRGHTSQIQRTVKLSPREKITTVGGKCYVASAARKRVGLRKNHTTSLVVRHPSAQ